MIECKLYIKQTKQNKQTKKSSRILILETKKEGNMRARKHGVEQREIEQERE